mgnify:CR=1 FL=1
MVDSHSRATDDVYSSSGDSSIVSFFARCFFAKLSSFGRRLASGRSMKSLCPRRQTNRSKTMKCAGVYCANLATRLAAG